MASITGIPNAQSVATVLAIGTATPPHCITQRDYPDFFFRTTNTNHLTNLKQNFTRLCEKSKVKKRHMHVTEDLVKKFPELSTFDEPSLDTRQDILVKEVPKLGMEAAERAIKEWGQPKSRLTHLIFCTTSVTACPSLDQELRRLLQLSPSVQSFTIYHHGCSACGAALRLAKDLAESHLGSARILVVGSDSTLSCFRAPSETRVDLLVGSAIIGDGAGAVVVGAHPEGSERPVFELLSAKQVMIPGSEGLVRVNVREVGTMVYLSKGISGCIEDNIGECVRETVEPFGVTDLNSLFYVVHPGGAKVLEAIEDGLRLTDEDELESSRHGLSEYGNVASPSVLFVLDEMRKRSTKEGKTTTGGGKEFGVMFTFGPGICVEIFMLRSVATDD